MFGQFETTGVKRVTEQKPRDIALVGDCAAGLDLYGIGLDLYLVLCIHQPCSLLSSGFCS
jgi:hypothetical protein